MNALTRPVFNLMNRLSYRQKFMLMASLFAIPLALFSGRLALTQYDNANQASKTREALVYMQEASVLLQNLEAMRDISVIKYVYSSPELSQQFDDSRAQIEQQIQRLGAVKELEQHHAFLSKLFHDIQNRTISPGNEGARIHTIFENANVLVEQGFLWQLELTYEFLSESGTNKEVLELLDTLNDNHGYFIALGEARAYGGYYLQQNFIDSKGIELLNKTYSLFTRLAEGLVTSSPQIKNTELESSKYSKAAIKQKLHQAQSLLNEKLLQVLEPSADSFEYFQEFTALNSYFHDYCRYLLLLADNSLKQQYQNSRQKLYSFYLLAIGMALILTYLYIGFYSYIRVNIRELVVSARRVAQGKYDQPIKIHAQDELKELASAMDEMRLKLKAREDELTNISQTDGLTQLKNRAFFDESLNIKLASSSRNKTSISLIIMDIDKFKEINDQHGHQTGDICLTRTAKLFKSIFKRKTDIVARYGGEEFVAILDGLSLEDSLEQTELLRSLIEQQQISHHEDSISITASFGIAWLRPEDAANANGLLELADIMLYQAKNDGRNGIKSAIFNPDAPADIASA